MRPFSVWLVIGLCVVVGMSGCAKTQILPKEAAFDANSASDKAIVIAGLAASRYDTFLGMTAKGSLGDFALSWVKTSYGGQGLPVALTDRISIPRNYCQPLLGLPSGLVGSSSPECDQIHMHHLVVSVSPGDYRLAQFGMVRHLGSLNESYTTRFKGTPIIIHVGPGEIVYIGDFVFDAIAFPARLVSYGRDDADAKAALAEYKGVHGEMVFRAPVTGTRGAITPGVEPPKLEAE